MDLKDKNLSLQFYNYLCNIVGSEEVVRTRREIFTEMDIVKKTNGMTFISSGSKAEGLDLKGSDYDQMMQLTAIRVCESLNNVQYDPEKVLIVMETNDTKPGFTKLKLVNKLFLSFEILHDWCETVEEETYISSKRFLEQYLTGGMIIHGPCLSTADGEYDSAPCFRCNEWITSAQQWIHRSRTAWPHDILVSSAVEYGVLFVPIGCKNSPNADLQWRISFSVTEKLLIHSFSHTQLLCYALMKIILKELIKPKHGDLLCSYFLKTIMFWLSEEINPSEWKPENMMSCFYNCIKRLIYCVEYKLCLHYFITENNLFEDRFTDKEHKALLHTLRFIYESPWISVFETSTFQNYRLESVNSHGMVLSASDLPCYMYMNILIVSIISQPIYSAIKRIVNVCLNDELCAYMLSLYATEVLQSSHLNMMTTNKYSYHQYKRTLCFFKISLCSDSISSWFLLASFFYKCNRFQECLVMIHYCLSRCNQNMIHLNFIHSLVEQTVFKEMKLRYGLLIAIKHLIIDKVFFRHPFCLLPDELIPFIVDKMLWIHPVMYMNLLECLCYHHLGDCRGK
ncbi:uncharacterized protein LOC127732234 [Mytilus californianus]|uniref:uncharacterized protein LOC127732234 n=1 Tax=Mytilus californianus TaxID=6549 RepID=UPI0022453F49|nr:uncharacterized protein LOC127732234 [Mytilus californianus]